VRGIIPLVCFRAGSYSAGLPSRCVVFEGFRGEVVAVTMCSNTGRIRMGIRRHTKLLEIFDNSVAFVVCPVLHYGNLVID